MFRYAACIMSLLIHNILKIIFFYDQSKLLFKPSIISKGLEDQYTGHHLIQGKVSWEEEGVGEPGNISSAGNHFRPFGLPKACW